MKKVIIYISLFIIGFIIGFSIMNIPKVRYDFNYNGKIDVADLIRFFNYYREH